MAVAAQEGAQAPRPNFAQGVITRAIRSATLVAAPADRLKSESAGSRQMPTSSWDSLVGTIKTGRMISLTLANSTRVEGRLVAIDANSISLEQPDGTRVFQAADVLRVRYASKRKRNVIRGMLIGMAVGGVATAIIDRQSSHPSSVVEAAGLGALVIGLPVGAAAGALVPSGQLLYEAATVRKTPPDHILLR